MNKLDWKINKKNIFFPAFCLIWKNYEGAKRRDLSYLFYSLLIKSFPFNTKGKMADFNIKQSYLLNFFAQFHQIYKRLSKMRHFERYTFEFDNQQFLTQDYNWLNFNIAYNCLKSHPIYLRYMKSNKINFFESPNPRHFNCKHSQ